MSKEQEHVCERYPLPGFGRDASFVVQPVVEVLPPLDRSPVEVAQDGFGLVQVEPFNDLLVPRVPVLGILGDCHNIGNAELCRIDLHFEDTAQSLCALVQ